MNESDELIKSKALSRLAIIFKLAKDALKPEFQFGVDLPVSFVSDFRRNEHDVVYDDILDVADRKTYKELSSGRLTIRTAGEYCDHMVRSNKTNPGRVKRLLKF